MKKHILTILASSFVLSCSTNSSNSESNNPVSNGLLVKTFTDSNGITSTSHYNGNKGTYTSGSDGSTSTLTYNGDLIIKEEGTGVGVSGSNYIYTCNYSNNLLTSLTENRTSTTSTSTYNSTYTYNSDGSITENRTGTNTHNGNTYNSSSKNIRFYSQGNCVKEERYNLQNGLMTLAETITYTYDSNNFPLKNITGEYASFSPRNAWSVNNPISEIHKNASGVITNTIQTTYQYNSQNYPISTTDTTTNYTPDLQTGTWTPGTPVVSTASFTYY